MIRSLRKFINRRPVLAAVALSFLMLVTLFSAGSHNGPTAKPPASSFTQLEKRIREHKVKSLVYDPGSFSVTVKEAGKSSYQIGVFGRAGEDKLLSIASENKVNVSSRPISNSLSWLDRIFSLLPTLLVIAAIVFLMRNVGPLKKSKLEPAKSEVGFADIGGVDEAVEELSEMRDFLADPRKFEKLGARVPKGVLLYGPPGTGKTLLAKAVAHEADVPFFSMSGSEFVEMFAGLGASRVRQLFKKAKEAAPSIIFIDELDAVGRSRHSGGSGAEREADQTLNQLLTEMDGFSVSEHPVIVMAASNRLDVLDQALLRKGRFDRHIAVDAPDRRGRKEILDLYARGKSLADDVDLEEVAIQTSGMTGADLANLMNEAALFAARRDADEIMHSDIEDAYMRVAAGAKKRHRSFTDHERRVVAFHEAGHALVSERIGMSDRVHKISILPRGQSGGQTLYVSKEDVFLHSKQELYNRLTAFLGGRAAEELVFEESTSGAADDLKRASEIARTMVSQLGMSESYGLLVAEEGHMASPDERAAADNEARAILQKCYTEAMEVLAKDTAALTRIANALLDEETLTRSRFLELLGEQPTDPAALAAQLAAAELAPAGDEPAAAAA
jgi:cell division protease FtsH